MPKLISERAARRLLKHELPSIGQLIADSWSDYMHMPAGERLKHDPRTRACLVRDNMVVRAKALVEGSTVAEVREQGGLFMVLLHGRVAVRFKKLDYEFMTSNIPTQQSIQFVRQELELPGVKPVAFLQAGYQLNGMGTDLDGVFLVCPNGTRNEWVIDLPFRAGGAEVVVLPKASGPQPAAPRLVPKVQVSNEVQRADGGV